MTREHCSLFWFNVSAAGIGILGTKANHIRSNSISVPDNNCVGWLPVIDTKESQLGMEWPPCPVTSGLKVKVIAFPRKTTNRNWSAVVPDMSILVPVRDQVAEMNGWLSSGCVINNCIIISLNCTKTRELSWCQPCCHWRHRKLP